MNQQALSSLIWSVADLLQGDFKQSEYGRVILPFTVLRRLDRTQWQLTQVAAAATWPGANTGAPRRSTGRIDPTRGVRRWQPPSSEDKSRRRVRGGQGCVVHRHGTRKVVSGGRARARTLRGSVGAVRGGCRSTRRGARRTRVCRGFCASARTSQRQSCDCVDGKEPGKRQDVRGLTSTAAFRLVGTP
jgi:hypothetical protein